MVLKEISRKSNCEYIPICIADDDRSKIGRSILGTKVYGSTYEIPQICENENIEILEGNGVLLHPGTQKEDTGVSYLVKYKGNNYRVRFFSADPDISDGTNGIAEYLRERTGREETMNMSMNGQYISIYTADHRQWFMSAFIDSGHYFDISTLATVEDFISFLTEFSYEKIDLEQ